MHAVKEVKETKRNGEIQRENIKPVLVVRRGAIAASVWLRQGPSDQQYYDFSLSRSWKSLASNNTGYSKNFFADQAEQLVEVIREAALWIEDRKRENQFPGFPNDEAFATAGLPGVGPDFTTEQLTALEDKAQQAEDRRLSQFQTDHRSYVGRE